MLAGLNYQDIGNSYIDEGEDEDEQKDQRWKTARKLGDGAKLRRGEEVATIL